MRSLKKYSNGGDVRDLLNALERQGRPLPVKKLPISSGLSGLQSIPPVGNQMAVSESTNRFPGSVEDPRFRAQKEREAADSFMFEAMEIGRKRQSEIDKLGFDPMGSGSAKSVTPMKFVSPVGDVEDMYEGLKMAYEGAKSGDAKKSALGGGLALGAAAMAFVPGNISMLRSFADMRDNSILDGIAKSLGDGNNLDDIYKTLDLENKSKAQLINTAEDVRGFTDLSMDPLSGLDLSKEELIILDDLATSLEFGTLPSKAVSGEIPPATVFRASGTQVELPRKVGEFELDITNFDGSNSQTIEYRNPFNDNSMDLTSTPVEDWSLARGTEYVDAYKNKDVHQFNMDMTDTGGAGANREMYTMMNKMMEAVDSGDLIDPGSLSSDSYPLYLNQLKRGKKYIEEGGKKQGTKIADKVSSNNIMYSSLNPMGRFGRPFGIPKSIPFKGSNVDWSDLLTDQTLSFKGTRYSSVFENQDEALEFMELVKDKYIDPHLKSRGLPPAKLKVEDNGIEDINHYFEFPIPITEKLLNGGKIKVNKKKGKGMKTKRYF